MKKNLFFIFLVICCAQLFWSSEVKAQNHPTCLVTVIGNNAPSRTIKNGDVICISGSRTSALAVDNLTNITIVINSGASFNSNLLRNISSLAAVYNYGTYHLSNDRNGDWEVYNYATLNLSTTLNTNKSIFNFSTLNVSNNPDINGSLISLETLNVKGNIKFQSNSGAVIAGTATISGLLDNNSTISLAGTLTAGSIKINGGKKIEALNGNQCNSISVSGEFYSDSNSGITGNNYDYQQSGSALVVNKLPTGNANPKLAGGAKVGSCPSQECLTTTVVSNTNGYDVVYIYRCSDIFILPQLIEDEELLDVQILTLAGGGGGGLGDASGGGGAGGISYQNNVSITPLLEYKITVGQGGLGAFSAKQAGTNGKNSDFNSTIIAQGGGGGGSTSFNNGTGNDGGFGGGGAYNGSSNANGGNSNSISNNKGGNSGNSGNGNQRSGGGGAGASSPGTNGNGNSGGNGADGVDLTRSCTNCPAYSTILLNVDNNILKTSGINSVIAAGGGGVGNNPGQGNGGGRPSAGNGGSSIAGNGNRDGKGFDAKNNSGSGGGGGKDGGGSGSNGLVIIRLTYRILPVDYLYFNATYQSANRKTQLEWSTAQEWGNSHFEVERAINSIKEWEVIARVDGNGYSNEPLAFTYTDDKLPVAGGNIFYRLKQVDDDASITYSNTEAIHVEAVEGKVVWVAFPNPISFGSEVSVSTLQPDQYSDEPISIHLINMLGEGESKVLSSPEEVSRMVSEWMRYKNAGLYILDIRWGNNSQQIKLLKN